MITVEASGSFDKTRRALARMAKMEVDSILEKHGQRGVDALANATPRASGETAQSWSYEVVRQRGSISIIWKNSHIEEGSLIAILIQYGHATGTGGYVPGRDFINPALRPIFDEIAADVWKEVTSS